MNRLQPAVIPFIVAAALLTACAQGEAPPAPAAPTPTPAVQGGEEEHDHGSEEGETSDLDRPVDELLAARCEHDRLTHTCEECRYEVGVVRVPVKLLDAGLVRSATAARRRVEAPVRLTGEVRLDERRVAHVAPRVEGVVRRVHATLGERVRRGQALLELESVQLGEAESELLSARAALQLAEAAADRQTRLRAEQITSEKEYLAARQELEEASIRARGAEERLRRLGASPAQLAAGREAAGAGGLVVRAPVDGVVLELHAVPGELVKPEESIATVGDVGSVWVWADLHEDQLGRVLEARRAGALRAEVEVRAFPGTTFPGKVDLVGPSMDERTRTVKLRVAVADGEARLRAGMFAGVRVFVPGAEEALAVPASAVLSDEGRSFVFLRHHGEYWIRRPVTPGRRWGEWVEIAGLAGGETLAADGAFLLKSDVLRSKMGAGCAD
ncbi:MAG: efflux RND transporter periplasmic adaptor subunit [Anaeromyxobacter sp.]